MAMKSAERAKNGEAEGERKPTLTIKRKFHMEIKQNMETRVGLILALWGVILSMVFQKDLPKIMI